MRRLLLTLMCLVALTGASMAETVGIWEIESAPISASQLTGSPSGNFNQWLNVVNAAIGANDALSGVSVLDDGIANLTSDALFQLNYASGAALNIAGTDLVLFDARYDAGSYAISTSYDGFTAELNLLSGSFLNTGEVRDYFFGGVPGPVFPSTIFGAAIDLSLLGVPDGVSVNSIRVRSLNADGADFIGVGSLTGAVPEPAALALLGFGVLAVVRKRRRKTA